MKNTILPNLVFILSIAGLAPAATCLVPDEYATIQAAIDACDDGDVVIIAPGTYTGDGNRDIDFKGKAITVRSSDPKDPNIVAATTIDCNGIEADPHRGFYFHNGENAQSLINGFTIKNGYAKEGGGIYCAESSPTISDCVISNNTAAGGYSWQVRGGGICSGEYSSPTITNCIISGNNTTSCGGGLHCGGMHPQRGATISNSIIYGNHAVYGGGISCSSATLKVYNCTIYDNTAVGSGGGILCSSGRPTVTNCTIRSNEANDYGGGIYCSGDQGPKVENCIMWGDMAQWGNEIALDDCRFIIAPSITIGYSNVQGGTAGVHLEYGCDGQLNWQDGNIDIDPCFVDPENGDFHLRPDSFCIDSATNTPSGGLAGTDIEENPRVLDGDRDGIAVADMGAYEALPTDEPVIWPSAWELEFSTDEGAANPESQTLTIRSRGGGNLNLKIAYDCDWLEVTRNGATSTEGGGEAILSAETSGLDVGTYNCYIQIRDPDAVNSPLAIPVALHILGQLVHIPNQFPTIQDGIDHAAVGGTVVVADGIYRGPGNRDIDFKGKPIRLRSANGSAYCMIDCQGSIDEPHRGFYFHCLEDANSIVDGFTIANGFHNGGGILCYEGSPTIRNCIIRNNTRGGIICGEWRCPASSNATIIDCVISSNENFGVFCDGQRANPFISRCRITDNNGWGLYSYGSSPTVTQCVVSGNTRAGMWFSYKVNTRVTNCLITGNNKDSWFGGGIRCHNLKSASMLSVFDCTISPNISSQDSGAGLVKVANCIIWGSETRISTSGTLMTVAYSDVQGGVSAIHEGAENIIWGPGNIDMDPRFVQLGHWADVNDPAIFVEPNHPNAVWVDGDYHLKSQAGRCDLNIKAWVQDDVTSPCIDAGEMASPIGFEPFPNGGIINMGAYGGTAEASKSYFGSPVCRTIVAGDINGDCKIDYLDFGIMAFHWLQEH